MSDLWLQSQLWPIDIPRCFISCLVISIPGHPTPIFPLVFDSSPIYISLRYCLHALFETSGRSITAYDSQVGGGVSGPVKLRWGREALTAMERLAVARNRKKKKDMTCTGLAGLIQNSMCSEAVHVSRGVRGKYGHNSHLKVWREPSTRAKGKYK
jgi:hypothetical protein